MCTVSYSPEATRLCNPIDKIIIILKRKRIYITDCVERRRNSPATEEALFIPNRRFVRSITKLIFQLLLNLDATTTVPSLGLHSPDYCAAVSLIWA